MCPEVCLKSSLKSDVMNFSEEQIDRTSKDGCELLDHVGSMEDVAAH